LPTDSYYHGAVTDYHWEILTEPFRNPASILSRLTSWPFLLVLPRQRTRYVRVSDVWRERALATAAIEFCDLPEPQKEVTIRRLAEFYVGRERVVYDKYGARD